MKSYLQKYSKLIFLILLGLSWLTFLNQAGRLNIFFEERIVEKIRPDSGHAWIADIDQPKLAAGHDLPVTFYEDGIPLERTRGTTTQSIRLTGEGTFTVWENGEICFAATDNSNPTENGRIYRVRYPKILENRSAKLIYLAALFAGFICMLLFAHEFWLLLQSFLQMIRTDWKFLCCVLLAISPFIICAVKFLVNQPLWGDEIFTLKNYIFEDNWYTPATVYDFPNNHILFNLIIGIYSRLTGIVSFCDVVLQPWLVRTFLLAISILTLILFAYSLKRIHPAAGVLGAILLASAFPFYAWTTQIRGYGISMFFVSALLALHSSILDAPTKNKFRLFSVLIAALIYVMPSNALLPIAYGCLLLVQGAFKWLKKQPFDLTLKMILSLLAGGFLSIVLYYPVLPQMKQVYLSPASGAKPEIGKLLEIALRNSIFELFRSVFWEQPILLILFLIGIAAVCTNKKLRKNFPRQMVSLLLFYLIVLLGFSAVTGSVPFSRNNLLVLPVVIFIAAIVIWNLASLIQEQRTARFAAVLFYAALAVPMVFKANAAYREIPSYEQAAMRELDKPSFLSIRKDLKPVFDIFPAQSTPQKPFIFSYPSEYYLYETCDCYQQSCYTDEAGKEAQLLMTQAEPYWLIETNWAGMNPASAREPYRTQCIEAESIPDSVYKIYICNDWTDRK